MTTQRRWPVPADHPAFDGHFPDQPILPGVALLAEVIETIEAEPSLRAVVGAAARLQVAKFLQPVGPGATLTIAVEARAGGVAFEVRDDAGHVAASGSFARLAAAAAA